MKLPTCRTRIVYVAIIDLLSTTAAGAREIDERGQCPTSWRNDPHEPWRGRREVLGED